MGAEGFESRIRITFTHNQLAGIIMALSPKYRSFVVETALLDWFTTSAGRQVLKMAKHRSGAGVVDIYAEAEAAESRDMDSLTPDLNEKKNSKAPKKHKPEPKGSTSVAPPRQKEKASARVSTLEIAAMADGDFGD